MHRTVVIVGSGPAGLAAALYAARANLEPLVLRGADWGGLIATTNEVENYPGVAGPRGGVELTLTMEEQAEAFGATFVGDVVTAVDLAQRPFRLSTQDNGTITAETLIVATGASPRKLGVPGEDAFTNRGVSYCATCDGPFFRNKRVVVVGGGNSALDEGLFLTRYVDELTIMHRRDTLRADPPLQARAFGNPKVRFLWNTVVTDIVGDDGVTGVRVANVATGEHTTVPTDGVFPFLGHAPNTSVFAEQLALDRRGYIVADARTRTSMAGVFAAGDVADPVYRQAITAAGDGAKAAMEATRFLAERTHGRLPVVQP